MTANLLYDENYYQIHCGPEPYLRNDRWLAFFGMIAREIVRSLAPRSVYDAGCAMGMLVESLWDVGVPARGADISTYAISNVRRDMVPFCRVMPITDPVEGRYDLVTCIEVLEHILPHDTERAIEAITAPTDTVLFSSSPSDLTEPTHVNVQPPIAWIEGFARQGFRPDLRYDASFLAPHAILFRRLESYVADDVDDLYALHVHLRTALVEREQRLGRFQTTAAELASAQVSIAELEHERDALQILAERIARSRDTERDDARKRIAAAGQTASAERESARVMAEHLRVAEERLARALAVIDEQGREIQALRAAVAYAPAAEEFAAIVRSGAALEERYRELLRADIELFKVELERLRRC